MNFNNYTYCNILVIFFACKTKCKYFFGIISFLNLSIDFFYIPGLSNFNSIFAISTISSYFS